MKVNCKNLLSHVNFIFYLYFYAIFPVDIFSNLTYCTACLKYWKWVLMDFAVVEKRSVISEVLLPFKIFPTI
jgi:hypothetical protein